MRTRAILLGVALAFTRFMVLLGSVLLVLWSYSLWGSAGTPLRHLFVPACVIIAAGLLIRLVLRGLIRWTGRAGQLDLRRSRLHEKIRTSRSESGNPLPPHNNKS